MAACHIASVQSNVEVVRRSPARLSVGLLNSHVFRRRLGILLRKPGPSHIAITPYLGTSVLGWVS